MDRLIISKQLEQASGANYTVLTDGSGNPQYVLASTVVSDNETVTTISSSGGIATFTAEDGSETDFNVNEQTVAIPLVDGNSVVVNASYNIFTCVPSWLDGYTLEAAYSIFENASGGSSTLNINIQGIGTWNAAVGSEVSISQVLSAGAKINFETSATSGSPEGLTVMLRFVPTPVV